MKTTILIRALVLGLSLAGPLATSVQAQADGRVGTVDSVRTRAVPNSGSTVGTVGGAVVGGVLGNQVGGGRGRTLATVGGAAGGAVVGNRLTSGTSTLWVVNVLFEAASTPANEQYSPPPVAPGDRVRVTNGGLQRLR